ncbi:hypothetical protein B0H12DRAFT_444482 [Mycena haematopus]|nr:hypothetical protein B0H12DRAFT_444482 [Mycena haematopus]
MFSTLTLTLVPVLLSTSAAMGASMHQRQPRSHSGVARRLESDNSNSTFELGKRSAFTNIEMTWYPTDTGPDACTGQNHQDSDYYVAMGTTLYEQDGCCGKQLTITVNGKTATATCVDECATCPQCTSVPSPPLPPLLPPLPLLSPSLPSPWLKSSKN